MLLPSSLPAQAASAIGSNNIIAARLADIPKCNPSSKVQRPRRGSSPFAYQRESAFAIGAAPMFKMRHRPGAIGEAMARGPGLISAKDSAGQWDEATPRGSVSAALGGRCRVLDRDLRELMLLEHTDPLVGMVMAVMLVMMASHLGIGIQHAVLRGLDRRCMRRPAGRHRGRGENGNGKHRCGNCLEHGCFLFQRDHEMAGRMAGFVDRWCDLRGGTLNPC